MFFSDVKKRLMLIANVHGVFQCPIGDCEHEGFRGQRGCTNFDEYPKDIMDNKAAPQNKCDEETNESRDSSSNIILDDAFSVKRLPNGCAALPVVLAQRHTQIRFALVSSSLFSTLRTILCSKG